jgi:phage terminase large subunit GpA-like protein
MAAPFSMYQVGAEAMLPPREITLSQWSDENVVLAGATAAERGQWQTRPYQREPMDVLSPSHPCKMAVLMSAAQMLKTSILVNFLGYIADVDPGPVLVVEPRGEDAKALSKDRVAPMFRNTPCLKGKLAAVKSRDSNKFVASDIRGYAREPDVSAEQGHISATGVTRPFGSVMSTLRDFQRVTGCHGQEIDRIPG